MRKQIVLSVVAGVASAAAGQTASLSIVPSSPTLDFNGTNYSTTLLVYADADFGTHITGAAFTLNANGGSIVDTMVATGAAWGDLGFDDLGHDGNGNTGMIMGQIVFLPFIQPDPASALGNGPVFLGSFAVNFEGNSPGGFIDWTVGGGLGAFALEVIDVNGNPGGSPPGEVMQFVNPNFSSVSMWVPPTPAPSSLVLLGFGGLVVGRRRR